MNPAFVSSRKESNMRANAMENLIRLMVKDHYTMGGNMPNLCVKAEIILDRSNETESASVIRELVNMRVD